MSSRYQKIEARLNQVERRLDGLEDALNLRDVLRTFPGGLDGLADTCSAHRSTIYRFARAEGARFHSGLAILVRDAFREEGLKFAGARPSVKWLRAAWERQKGKQDGQRRGQATAAAT